MFKFEIGQTVYIQDRYEIKSGKVIGRMIKDSPQHWKDLGKDCGHVCDVGSKLGTSTESYEIQYENNKSTVQESENIFACWEQFRDKYCNEFLFVRPTTKYYYCQCGRNVIVNEPNKFCSLCNRGI